MIPSSTPGTLPIPTQLFGRHQESNVGIGPAGEGVVVGGGPRGGGEVGERGPGSVETDAAELVCTAFGACSPSGWEVAPAAVGDLGGHRERVVDGGGQRVADDVSAGGDRDSGCGSERGDHNGGAGDHGGRFDDDLSAVEA
jgi:hypothetical protein